MAITVTYVDDSVREFPSATVVNITCGSKAGVLLYTNDYDLVAEDGTLVAIIGQGTFKAIEVTP